MTKRLLVQFFHPGPEFDRAADRANWTDQNQPHRRKFMQVRGRRAEGTGSGGDDLAIWGEWEPQAECVQTLNGLGVGLPKRLWRPYYDLSTAPPNRLNTDPLVFGGFRYTVCQQHRRYNSGWRPTGLQQLAAGSVILFGSHLDGDFVLDTMFVVKEGRRHNPSSYLHLSTPQPYVDITLATLYEGVSDRGCCKTPDPGDQYTLYDGATDDEPFEGMYSFVPCKPIGLGEPGFARPRIRHPLLSSTQTQRYGFPVDGNDDAIVAVWREVRDQVLGQDLALATWLEFPPRRP